MIRRVDTTAADQESARVFFDTLFAVYNLTGASILDAFARNGQLTVSNYVNKLALPKEQLHLWELMPEHEEALRQYTPHVRIGDSYQLIQRAPANMYDLIVVDTPQGLHEDKSGKLHAEHWDFVEKSLISLKRSGLLVLYVNKMPYDAREKGSHGYDEYREYNYDVWMEMRRDLYGFERSHADESFVAAYRRLLKGVGRDVQSMVVTPCHSDVEGLMPYAFRLGLEVV